MDVVFLVVSAGSLIGACVYGCLICKQLAGRSNEVNMRQTEVKENYEELLRMKREQSADRRRIKNLRFIRYRAASR